MQRDSDFLLTLCLFLLGCQANVIAMQYAVSPVLLSFTMTVAIGVASEWS